jgi:hypothetical protein
LQWQRECLGILSDRLLGFLRKQTNDFIVFREAEHHALILLPMRDDRSLVGDPHLVAVKNTVVGKGIATMERLSSLLYTPQVIRPALPKSSVPGYDRNGKKKSPPASPRLIAQASQEKD